MALASPNIGGVIENNFFDGDVVFSSELPAIIEITPDPTVTAAEADVNNGWNDYYVSGGGQTLQFKGNELHRAYTKIPSDLIDDKTLKYNTPGYDSLYVLNNVFHSWQNSFIGVNLFFSENQFYRDRISEHTVAFVLMREGRFMGNHAEKTDESQTVKIQRVYRTVSDTANLAVTFDDKNPTPTPAS